MDELNKAFDDIRARAKDPLPTFGRTAVAKRLQRELNFVLAAAELMASRLEYIANYRKDLHTKDRREQKRPRLFNAGDVPILEQTAAITLSEINDVAGPFNQGLDI